MENSSLPRLTTRPPAVDRLLVIFSDIEMGSGGPTDDFPHSDFLASIIRSYDRVDLRDLPIDLIFNGDTFDLLKTDFEGTFPIHITASVAVAKLSQIAAAHAPFFAALREFLVDPVADRRVQFIVGNHDAELVFTEVQSQIRSLCGNDARVLFPGFRLAIGGVLVEHGSQSDRMFQVDEEHPIVEFEGQQILHISWGAVALLKTVIPLKELLGFHDRLKPKQLMLDLLPELHGLLMSRFWSYWSHDFWKGYVTSSDPTQEITWAMLKEVIWRFSIQSPEVLMSDGLVARMRSSSDFQLYVVGHQHESQWLSFGDRKILQSGCLRNEYMVDAKGETFRPIPKSYVEAWMREGVPVVSALVEFEGPPAPAGYLPRSIFDVLAGVRALQAPEGDAVPVIPLPTAPVAIARAAR
jgi:UDP-2,3-diacylglucosamine pyrophosphatase LpxH